MGGLGLEREEMMSQFRSIFRESLRSTTNGFECVGAACDTEESIPPRASSFEETLRMCKELDRVEFEARTSFFCEICQDRHAADGSIELECGHK